MLHSRKQQNIRGKSGLDCQLGEYLSPNNHLLAGINIPHWYFWNCRRRPHKNTYLTTKNRRANEQKKIFAPTFLGETCVSLIDDGLTHTRNIQESILRDLDPVETFSGGLGLEPKGSYAFRMGLDIIEFRGRRNSPNPTFQLNVWVGRCFTRISSSCFWGSPDAKAMPPP